MADLDELQQGRDAYDARAWRAAHDALSRADLEAGLGAADLELLATSSYMLGRDDEYVSELELAHHAHLQAGATLRAARCAFWTGTHLFMSGELGRGSGWLGRAQRLVDGHGEDCVEQGYLLLPRAFRHESAGDMEAGAAVAAEVAAIGQRFGDQDLFALATHLQGHLLVNAGRVDEGLALLDEAMVSVTTGELSPIASGLVYCGVILGCQAAYEPRRAQQWTAALTRWCERQPDMVAFSGRCLVHRAEIMQLRGAWPEALEEARRASRRAAEGDNRKTVGEAAYLEGEIHRLRGRFEAAEAAYREAGHCGREAQPGLSLLRLAQGNADAACAAIRRAVGETTDRLAQIKLLPACVEILLAGGDVAAARSAAEQLQALAAGHASDVLEAIVEHARGAVELADGDPAAALPSLRRAWRVWHELEAPYEAARARILVGRACHALGDDDAARLELGEARDALERLGAGPDLASIDAGEHDGGADDAHGLSRRELQVLRRLVAGATNRQIASELVLSQRTIDRHVSNIYVKLGVSSRAAATAYAYRHELL